MNYKKYIKIILLSSLTVFLSFSVAYTWTGLIASDGDTLTSAKWNELVNKVLPITSDGTNLEVGGKLIRTIHHATANGPDDSIDNGQIVTRILDFTKEKANTEVRISYTDSLRAYAVGKACRWELKVDGNSCPDQSLVYDVYNGGSNPHHVRTFVGYCSGLSSGSHEVQIWVTNSPNVSGSDCHTGWNNNTWVIEAEEVN